MRSPLCSLIVVQYGGLLPLKDCLDSVLQQTYPADAVELLVVDNGSDEAVRDYLASHLLLPPLINDQNNYARALNLAIGASRGEYVAFLNNDVVLDREWLQTLVEFLEQSPRAAAAGGKILLADGRINSVGLEDLGDFRWQDQGFEQEDHGQYDCLREVKGLCWASVLFRRLALEKVGCVDEDFVMYYEDVEYSLRCHQQGWTMHYVPSAVSRHGLRASSRGSSLTAYFCNRNRLLFVAKHHPRALPRALETAGEPPSLVETLPHVVEKLLNSQDSGVLSEVLPGLRDQALVDARSFDGLLARAQLRRGHRRISLGLYDHAMHHIGGGQKYAATMAEILQEDFDVTFIANRPVRLRDLEEWYRLDLSRCDLKIVPLPFFETREREIDPTSLTDQGGNPFDPVSEESGGYDIFVNANMADKVAPYSPTSLFVCHFPVSARGPHFSTDRYGQVISSGQYGANWCFKRWGLSASVLYPSVELESAPVPKEQVILSSARFERGGSKRQIELIASYRALVAEAPDLLRGWRLVLAGGSIPNNPYLLEVLEAAREGPGTVEVRVNLSFHELQDQYARADLFWHACGLGETKPEHCEHFGMTTVEAMQNRCVPIVIGVGGQVEIVEHGRSGLLFNSELELRHHTLRILRDEPARERLRQAAWQRSQQFRRAAFEVGVRRLFGGLRDELMELRRPDPTQILRSARRSV